MAALAVRVWGEWACFTRPETKVERVSYPVMTPSAARGVLEAIFWKPQFNWLVERIDVLKDIRYSSIRRNEVKSRAAARTARRWARKGGGYSAISDRTQRHTLALRDVAYVIYAHVDVDPDCGDTAAKFRDQFRRRVAKGRCFARPYLGCREFAAEFAPRDPGESPIARSQDLGPMLLDLDYLADGFGRGTPRFFAAKLKNGVLHVPHRKLPGVA
jgi:CRISPR-associated protein Cas5d